MDRSNRSHSPTRTNKETPISKPAQAQRNISTASGMAASGGTTGNYLLDHSLRIDGTRRSDNSRNRAKDMFGNANTVHTSNNNNNKESSPPTPTTSRHDNRNNTMTANNNNTDHDILHGNRYHNNNNNNNNNNGRNTANTTNNNHNDNTTNNGGLRSRAYSWRGERPPSHNSGESKEEEEAKNDIIHVVSSELLPMTNREARSVTAWVIIATLIQLALSLLVQLASYHHDPFHHNNYWIQRVLLIPSLLAGMVLEILPQKVFSNQAPGFIYASAWLLMGVQEKLGCIPHIPSRICAGVLGRLSIMECAVAVTVQFTCTISTTLLLQYCLFSNKIANLALKPIEYTSSATGEDGNPWIVDFFHELIVNTLFTIALQVVPVLLRLNRASRWWTLLFVYPMYMYSVDSSGQGSALSPSILFALSYSRKDACQLIRCVAQILSGLAAGKIMQVYFPDDPKEA